MPSKTTRTKKPPARAADRQVNITLNADEYATLNEVAQGLELGLATVARRFMRVGIDATKAAARVHPFDQDAADQAAIAYVGSVAIAQGIVESHLNAIDAQLHDVIAGGDVRSAVLLALGASSALRRWANETIIENDLDLDALTAG
jgi:hypothetical protein